MEIHIGRTYRLLNGLTVKILAPVAYAEFNNAYKAHRWFPNRGWSKKPQVYCLDRAMLVEEGSNAPELTENDLRYRMAKAWFTNYGSDPMLIREVVKNPKMRRLLEEIAGDKSIKESLSWWLRKHTGQDFGGVVFVSLGKRDRFPTWQAVDVNLIPAIQQPALKLVKR